MKCSSAWNTTGSMASIFTPPSVPLLMGECSMALKTGERALRICRRRQRPSERSARTPTEQLSHAACSPSAPWCSGRARRGATHHLVGLHALVLHEEGDVRVLAARQQRAQVLPEPARRHPHARRPVLRVGVRWRQGAPS
eukprot:scaffold1915_cov288-Prasinococcus_capsulatus_cf.AAC.5